MPDILALAKETPIIDLGKQFPKLTNLIGELTWSMHPLYGESLTQGFDLDLAAFCLNSSGKISGGQDVVFYGNPNLAGGSVSVPVDNRTGKGALDETVVLDLNSIPTSYVSIDLYVSVFEATKRNQNFGMMVDAKFTLKNGSDNTVMQSYRLEAYPDADLLYVGRVSRTPAGWSFDPIGEPSKGTLNTAAGKYL